jgi:hypothetical protein
MRILSLVWLLCLDIEDKANQTLNTAKRSKSPSAADRAKSGVCPGCTNKYFLFTRRARGGWNVKPHEKCSDCWKAELDKRRQKGSANQISGTTGAITGNYQFGQISGVSVAADRNRRNSKTCRQYHRQLSQKLNGISHHVFSKGSWRQAQLRTHPTVQLSIAPDHSNQKVMPVTAIADAGA